MIGIDREGHTIINPTADENLQVGDRVLLLGDDEQLAEAKLLLLRLHPSPVAAGHPQPRAVHARQAAEGGARDSTVLNR